MTRSRRARRRRAWAGAVGILLPTWIGAGAIHVHADGTSGSVDEALADAVESAPAPTTRIAVEVVTGDTTAAAREVRILGGSVTGTVPGEIVQATLPAGRVDDVATPDGAFLRLPRRVNRPAELPLRIELGPVTGQAVAVTNAAGWHAAGLRGAVKVGVIDFFDLGLWDPAEHGARPDAAHVFCRDTSGHMPNYCPMAEDGLNLGDGAEHGVAVVEVLKDIAPDAELYLATVATTSDLRAAIDWFAANGVFIVNRSLGAPYDGPGDGTGPLAAVVDHAAALGITWFNSAGNDGAGRYGRYTNGVTGDGYVDFDNGPGVDTTLTISGSCIQFDGIRWNDWGKPASAMTDYRVELFDPARGAMTPPQADQARGAPPLELADEQICVGSGQLALRVRRVATGGDARADVIEIAVTTGRLETGRSQVEHSAAKSVVDSRNPALVAVGAVDPPAGTTAGSYSAQGPTNDGRVKPDITGPSCVTSTIYRPPMYGAGACFNGTSASAPVAAGFAALLAGRGLATAGAPLAALTRHLVVDVDPPGPDNSTGVGLLRLPAAPPAALEDRPARYIGLSHPRRVLDTRLSSLTAGAAVGPFAPFTVVDVAIPADVGREEPVTAVAVSIVSVDAPTASYVQAVPTLMARMGGSASVNVPRAGRITPNFAIVPVGAEGAISLLLAAGGNVVVDLMGVFTVASTGDVTAGRFVPAGEASRVLDTRDGQKPAAQRAVRVGPLAPGASAVVVNITTTEADAPGFLVAHASGVAAAELRTANGNFETGAASGMLSIVPLGADGTIEVVASARTHIVVDLVGWFTGADDVATTSGRFVALPPARAYDSRFGPGMHSADDTRTIVVAGPGSGVPVGAIAVSANVAADQAAADGFVTVRPAATARALILSLNFPAGAPVSNAALLRTAADGRVDADVNRSTHVIIDVNGYFTGPA